jgi:hypothetical protein
MLIHSRKRPGTFDQRPESLPQLAERGGRGRQVGKSYQPALNRRVEKR